MTEKIVTAIAEYLLNIGINAKQVNAKVLMLDQFAENLRQEIASDLEALETPKDISSDYFAASSRTKMAAIAVVRNGLPK